MDLRERLQESLGAAYTIERELGGGGMSRVFVATETALARSVVIKVLSPDIAAELSAQRFTREIRLAAALQQANVVPVLTTGEAAGLPYYIMPFVDGLSLRERLTRDGRLEIANGVGVLRDVARALAYAHDNGVVHRDVKPENVLLSGATAMVTDFGIAKAITAARDDVDSGLGATTTVTQAGTAIGTPAYMSPEQIASDPSIDHRADLYSFGCLAYEVLTGQAPFGNRPPHQQFTAHLSERAAPVETLCPECSPALARMVGQCLEKDPARRPASAHDILRTLDTASVATTGVRRMINRLSPRQRFALNAAVVAFGALAIGLGARSWMRTPPAAGESSLAILPFVNIGPDSTKNLWADGLTDQVTTIMSRAGNLRLATRASADRFRNRRNVDARDAGRALQVRHVLQGTLWPQDNRVRVVVLLSSADDGREIWRDSFERDAGDILATLDSITNGITVAVQRHVLGAAPSPPTRSARGTSDTTAFDLYLRAEALLRARGNAVPRAVELFRQATARDPRYARAYAGLSDALEVLPNFADTTFADVHDAAVSAARQALALDSTLAEAQTALALASMHAMQWAEADSQFRRAIGLDAGDPSAHFHYGRYLAYVGRYTAAVDELQRAKRLDPTSPVIGAWLARLLFVVGRRADAATEIDRALELDSMSVPVAFMGADISVARGQLERARRLAEITWRPQGVPRPAPWPGSAALVYGQLGDTGMVRTILDHIARSHPSRAFGHSMNAVAALAAHDTTRALDEMERANEAREFWPSAPILGLPEVDQLRKSQRFAALIKKAGLNVALFTAPRGGRPQ